ncbi:MAG: nuclear transport factor 2 family protein [Chloroflexi bacterium]|nr:nuclear transport factor 2 family protein [Chloroflexota bacterium]
MAHVHEQVVREAYAAFSAGDLDGLRGTMTEDITWHVPGRNRFSGDYVGMDKVLGYLGRLAEESEGTFHIEELHDVLAGDEHAVSLHRSSAVMDGEKNQFREILVFHFKDGKISEIWEAGADTYEYDAVFG